MSAGDETGARCGAKTRSGKPCQRSPCKGKRRCRLHGGAPGSGSRPITGRYSKAFARIDEPTQEAIDHAIQDPNLLDVRRPVALQQVIIQSVSLVPDDDLVRSLAKRMSRWRPGKDESWENQPDPTAAELELARIAYVQQTSRLNEAFGELQSKAAKVANAHDLLAKMVVPLFAELGLRMAKLGERYVPSERREDFLASFRVEVRQTMAAILDAIDQ